MRSRSGTSANTLSLTISPGGAGPINVNETNAVSLTNVGVNGGNVSIAAGGTLTTGNIDVGASDLSLTTTGSGNNILAGTLACTNISLTAGGATVDNNGITNNLNAASPTASAGSVYTVSGSSVTLAATGGISDGMSATAARSTSPARRWRSRPAAASIWTRRWAA